MGGGKMATRHDTMKMLEYEHTCMSEGKTLIAGVDEVGRGPLAGPVVVACVIMPLADDQIILGVNDSKKLSEAKRNELFDKIMQKAIAVKIESADQTEIDEINILNATKKCMKNAVNNMPIAPQVTLIDAVKIDCNCPIIPIIKGDAISYSIACASIVAKVTRDRFMVDCDKIYPQYDFASNKGYGTAKHIEALKSIGACVLHRRSFIKNFVDIAKI